MTYLRSLVLILSLTLFPVSSFSAIISDVAIIAPTEELVRICENSMAKGYDDFKKMMLEQKCAVLPEGSNYDMVKQGRFISKIRVQGSILYSRTKFCCKN